MSGDITRGNGQPESGAGVEIRKTICSICNPISHCGVNAHVKDGVVVKIEGDPDNPHNAGGLCSKGAAGRQYVYHPDRILTPLIRRKDAKSGRFDSLSWDEALAILAERLLRFKEESGPESVVFFAGYPKWMRPFLKRLTLSFGSPNYLTESSTCSAGAAMAYKLNYGAIARPDLGAAKALLVWSSNPFYSNTSAVRKLLDAIEGGLKIIEVGPLITPLTRHADIYLRIRPGTSGALALSMAHVIIEEGLYDREFVENWSVGFQKYRDYVREFEPSEAERITGVPASKIVQAAKLYGGTKPAGLLTGPSATVHHTNGIQNHRALTMLIGLTGNFDVQGGNHVAPPSYLYVVNGAVTRQVEFERARDWRDLPPRVGGDRFPVWTRLVEEGQALDLSDQIRGAKPYPLRAMVAFGLNHRMWSAPDYVAESLSMLDFLVDIDLFMTDSARLADMVLPACSSFERRELKFYPEKHVVWTQPAIRPLGESRPDTDIIFELARRIAPDDQLLSQGYESCVDWILQPTGLTVEELKRFPGGKALSGVKRPPFKKYEQTGFATPSGKMEFCSCVLEELGFDPLPRYREPGLSPRSDPETAKNYPLILTTGARLPMFIHSRTFRLPWARGLRPDPMADMNPLDARARGVVQGDPVELSTPRGAISVRANLTEIVPPGVVNMYHGYPEADVNSLIAPDYLDPISGYPGYKSLLCQITKTRETR